MVRSAPRRSLPLPAECTSPHLHGDSEPHPIVASVWAHGRNLTGNERPVGAGPRAQCLGHVGLGVKTRSQGGEMPARAPRAEPLRVRAWRVFMHRGGGEIDATALPRAVWALANPKSPWQDAPPGAGAAAGGRACKCMCINTYIILLTPKVTRCKQFDKIRNYGKRNHHLIISVSFKLSGIFLIFFRFPPVRVQTLTSLCF